MKAAIHPTYYDKAKVSCACGNSFVVGSTRDLINPSICSACHPFYTGTEKIVDTQGRVDRFKKRLEKGVKKASKKTTKR
ncbi:MAG TPA: 50S ribosomal protein L31 [Candidatus Paceibacterota bacterium]|nr:50S ribosomal protein L31 [Candidatus Paceibacterota bacterium]